jgi:cell division protein FtsB
MARPPVRKPTARKPAAKRPVKAAKGASRVSSLSQDTRNWIASNFDARNALVLVMIVVGVVTVAPNVQTFFSYRQQIADMQAQVDAEKKELADMIVERKRWDDPVYVRSQARQRLYYVLPGEVSYLVMDAGSVNTSDKSGTVGAMLADRRNTSVISSSIRTTSENWVDDIVGSVIRAGIEEPVVEEPAPKETKAPNN